jgi:carbonic anhydrase
VGLVFLQVSLAGDKTIAPAPATEPSVSATDEMFQRLLAGNERYVADRLTHTNQSAARRIEVAKGQKPAAIVLTCSDSRVAPELILTRDWATFL